MAGGIYSGLGRGIQDALGIFLQMDQQGKAEKRQAMLDARQAENQALDRQIAEANLKLSQGRAAREEDSYKRETTLNRLQGTDFYTPLDAMLVGDLRAIGEQGRIQKRAVPGAPKPSPDLIGVGEHLGQPALEEQSFRAPTRAEDIALKQRSALDDLLAQIPDPKLRAAIGSGQNPMILMQVEALSKGVQGLTPGEQKRFNLSMLPGVSANEIMGPLGTNLRTLKGILNDQGQRVTRIVDAQGQLITEVPEAPTAGERKEARGSSGIREQIRSLVEMGDATGWKGIGGMGQGTIRSGLKSAFGVGDDREDMLRTAISSLQADVAHEKYGAAFTATERAMLRKWAPGIDMHPSAIKNRLAQMDKVLEFRERQQQQGAVPTPLHLLIQEAEQGTLASPAAAPAPDNGKSLLMGSRTAGASAPASTPASGISDAEIRAFVAANPQFSYADAKRALGGR